jgi:hypothetical protein
LLHKRYKDWMKFLIRVFTVLGIGIFSLVVPRPVFAFPPLPSSFYGTVKVRGANTPDGTRIQASIGGKVIAESVTSSYQGNSVYTIDVPGDDSSTTMVEGGQDGDKIFFIIAGLQADQTGTWKSGTNTNLVLTVPMVTPYNTPTVTIIPASTNAGQPTTAATTQQPADDTTTVTEQVPPTADLAAQESPTASTSLLSTREMTTVLTQPAQTDSVPVHPERVPLDSNLLIMGVFIGVLLLIVIIWLVFVRKPKA